MSRVKICGITNTEDALVAAEAGADALGFIFYPPSPRSVTPELAAEIVREIPPFVTPVGVFVDEEPETIIRCRETVGFRAIQLSGNESPETAAKLPAPVIKCFRVGETFHEYEINRYSCSAVLLDTYVRGVPGGTGQTFDWEIARRWARRTTLILAGGLTPENVAHAIYETEPYAVDVASGVESSPGKKDHVLLKAFIEEAKCAFTHIS